MISSYAFLFKSIKKNRYNPINLLYYSHAYEVWMKQIVQNMKSGETQIVDVPVPIIQPGFLLIRTAASLVSAGTERKLVSFAEKNLLGKAQTRPDLMKQVLEKARREGILTTINAAFNRLDQPLTLGYSSAGTVIQVGSGVIGFKPGDWVVCAGGGYAVHAEYALVPVNLAARLPKGVNFESGAFATIGAIALNGIRLANPQVGEISAVIGMGLLGLLTAQMLKASGCEVVGMDINPDRLAFAQKVGIIAKLNKSIKEKFIQMTRGRGFDHVFICADTTSSEPVELAGEIARDRAHVIAIGAVGMEIPRKQYYEKELTFKIARSYGPGRYDHNYEENGGDYPIGYVRWTEGRNLEAVVDLIKQGKLDVASLITHRFPIDHAEDAYALITSKQKQNYLGVIITYPDINNQMTEEKILTFPSVHTASGQKKLNIGVVGAGNYANAVFLPTIKKNPLIDLLGIVSAKGLNAQQSARKFGFAYAGSHTDTIFKDAKIDLVTILTQHTDHADLVKKGLQAGKHIYCEKPLAITKKQLESILPLLKKKNHPYLTVGFNRRFAPYSKRLKSFFEDRVEPIYAHYRVNAGFIPSSHWLHDPSKGGGRLIGEGCHFIDYLVFLVGQIPESVHTQALPDNGKYTSDNFVITMVFSDGSIGTISYLANGNKLAGKEYLEVFCGGKAIPYTELIGTAYVTLACDQSMRIGQLVNIKDFIHAK
jgi:predicted dehydrogenase/threonine dehydrogenase-like Zn-dependent dehydrogenase